MDLVRPVHGKRLCILSQQCPFRREPSNRFHSWLHSVTCMPHHRGSSRRTVWSSDTVLVIGSGSVHSSAHGGVSAWRPLAVLSLGSAGAWLTGELNCSTHMGAGSEGRPDSRWQIDRISKQIPDRQTIVPVHTASEPGFRTSRLHDKHETAQCRLFREARFPHFPDSGSAVASRNWQPAYSIRLAAGRGRNGGSRAVHAACGTRK